MRVITDLVRVFLFGLAIAVLGLINPTKALDTAQDALDRRW